MDVFDLYAKITLDSKEYDQGLTDAKDKASNFADQLGSFFGGAAAAVGTATVAAVAAAGSAVVSIVSDAIESYANYEQLVGGVETMFKESAGIVQDYAMEAYMTAGISANDYMDQVMSFSASLISSLAGDTEAAAQTANMAITDMADNANKMGSSIESIQNAYQGFAKQNYTMLDNLKLGYGGTKEEMERLLEDAEKLSGIEYDISNLNDVFNAIHVIQEELGITGTTALEAEETISGSLGMVKAAWEDLMTSVAGGGKGLEEAIDALVNSAETLLENIIPVVEEALYGIGDLVSKLAPIIAERLPDLISNLTPMLLEAAMSIVDSLINALPQLIGSIADALIGILPQLVDAFLRLFDSLLTNVIPAIIEIGIELVLALGRGIAENVGGIMDSVVSLIQFLVNIFIENLPVIIEIGLKIILALVTGLVDNLPKITGAIASLIVGIIDTVIGNLDVFLSLGLQIILKIAEGILLAIPLLVSKFMIALNILPEGAKVATDDTKKSFTSLTDDISSATDTIGKHLKTSSDSFSDFSKEVNDSLNSADKYSSKSIESISETTTKLATSSKITKMEFNDNFLNMQIFAAAVAEDIAGSFSDMASGIESAATRISDACNDINKSFSSLSSPNISMNVGGARASGGYISAGMSYLVGEMGPELITPSREMYVHNAQETASMLGGKSIVINVNGDVYDDQRSMTRKLRNAMLSVLEEQMAYG